MRTLFAFLMLLPMLAIGQAPPFLRSPLTTNVTRFTNPQAGDAVLIHSTSPIVLTNGTVAAGSGNPGGGNDSVQVRQSAGVFGGADHVFIPTGRSNLLAAGAIHGWQGNFSNQVSVASIPIAMQGFVTNLFLTNKVIVNPYDWTDLTNKAQLAVAGQTVVVPPGPRVVHVPTNTLSLLRPGVDFEFWTDVVFGTKEDTTGRPVFAERSATTNNIYLYNGASLIVSNRNTALAIWTNAATTIRFHGGHLKLLDTNTSFALLWQWGGKLETFNTSTHTENYDNWIGESSALIANFKGGAHTSADSAFETSTAIATGRLNIDVDRIERNDAVRFINDFHSLIYISGGNVSIKSPVINLSSNGVIFFLGSSDSPYPVVECPSIIRGSGVAKETMQLTARVRFVNSTIFDANWRDMIYIGENSAPVFDNVSIFSTGGATNVFWSLNDRAEVEVIGGLRVNKGFTTNIFSFGGPVINTNTVTVTLSADDQEVYTGGRRFLELTSDNTTAANRTAVLMEGTAKQELTIRWAHASNRGELLDSGTHQLVGTWSPVEGDVIDLYWNGTAWEERGRSRSLTNSSAQAGTVAAGVADKVWKTDSSGNPAWRDDATGAGGGDSGLVNATAISDSFSLTNTAASSTVASTTWSVSAGTDPDPDKVSVAIGAATDSVAGILTAGTQTIGGIKTWSGAATFGGTVSVEGALGVANNFAAESVTATNGITNIALTASRPVLSDANKALVSGQIDLSSANHVTGTLADGSIPTAITRDTEWDTESEVQTAWGSVNILLETEIDASSELRALMDDEVGTGNLMFTRVGVVREIWVSAGAITPATTNGAALGTNTVGADGLTLDVLDFDDTTTEYGWFTWAPPDSWDHGTVKAKFVWTTITGTGGVVWGLAGGAVADDGTLNGAILGTAVTVADTRLADHDLHLTAATGAITVGGTPTLAKPVFWRVHRLPSDGSDTKTGDARLIGIKIQYTETSTEAAAW